MLDAVFAAGAALAALDAVVRRGDLRIWRRRLALRSAAACLSGRREDEAALRDVFALSKPGVDPGPAGRVYRAWRGLADPGATRRWPEIAAGLDAPPDAAVALAPIFATHAQSSAPAPIAAAAAATALHAAFPRCGDPLAFALADAVLAARLGWPATLPLLAPAIARARPGEAKWDAACCAAYARAAVEAFDLHDELFRAAGRLLAIGPKLRAKGSPAAIAALLDDDALTAAAPIAGMTDRGLRRLFDRLVALGAIRELSGRATFRLYGL